jgi:hypothetical protein
LHLTAISALRHDFLVPSPSLCASSPAAPWASPKAQPFEGLVLR